MFTRAEKVQDYWLLSNGFGHRFCLPCYGDYSGRTLAIGALGTGTRVPLKLRAQRGRPRETKTELMASMLASLDKPLYLLDTRRTGVGGQGSWAPLEFATLIPGFLGARASHAYSYLHLPCLAPSMALLRDDRAGALPTYHAFARRYREEHPEEIWDIGRAFVESAATAGGLAVLLCAEADQPAFATLATAEQHAHYCHRFTLAQQVARRIEQAYHGVQVQLVHLDLVDYCAHRDRSETYVPRVVRL